MKTKLLAAVALVAFASPAVAAFYVVQDSTTRSCSIVEQKPSGSSMIVVGGDNKVYQSRAEAETDMRAAAACRPSTTGATPGAGAPGNMPSSPNR